MNYCKLLKLTAQEYNNIPISYSPYHGVDDLGAKNENTYELLNLRALKISM